MARICACRRYIRPESPDPADIEAAVKGHQRTDAHAQWRALGGLEMVTAMPPVAVPSYPPLHVLPVALRRIA